jgi:hypothetical protein
MRLPSGSPTLALSSKCLARSDKSDSAAAATNGGREWEKAFPAEDVTAKLKAKLGRARAALDAIRRTANDAEDAGTMAAEAIEEIDK